MIEGKVTGDGAVIARFSALPEKFRSAVITAVKREWFRLQAKVVREKLSGDPLHRRTGVLASSINVGGTDTATEFTEDSAQIVARIGTRVRYGRVHEEGGTFNVKEHTRHVTSVFGRAVAEGTVTVVRAHQVTFPQRSFLRSTLNEERSNVLAAIQAAAAQAAHE